MQAQRKPPHSPTHWENVVLKQPLARRCEIFRTVPFTRFIDSRKNRFVEISFAMKLKRFLLRYYPPGLILEYETKGELRSKDIDLLDLTEDTDLDALATVIIRYM